MRISRVSLFFFIIGFNYIFIRAIIFPFFYESYGMNGLIYINILQAIITLFFLLLPKSFYNKDFYKSFTKSKIKYIYNIILLLRIILGITIGCYIMHVLFFYNQSFLLLPLGIIIVIILLSIIKPSEIIQLSTLFGLVLLLTYFIYLYNFIDLDFSLLFKGFNYKFDWIYILLLLGLLFDNFNYFIVDKDNLTLDKKTITLAFGVVMLLFSIEYSILALSSGDKLFLDYPLVGFVALSIEPVSRYNGNFDYIYVLMIVVTAVFKYAYFLSVIRNSVKIKFNKLKYILLAVILFIGSIFIYWLYGINIEIIKWIAIILFLFSSIIFLWIIKENIYAKKIQE